MNKWTDNGSNWMDDANMWKKYVKNVFPYSRIVIVFVEIIIDSR